MSTLYLPIGLKRCRLSAQMGGYVQASYDFRPVVETPDLFQKIGNVADTFDFIDGSGIAHEPSPEEQADPNIICPPIRNLHFSVRLPLTSCEYRSDLWDEADIVAVSFMQRLKEFDIVDF